MITYLKHLNYFRFYLYSILFYILIFISSCASNKISVYSDNRFTPISKVETDFYKSPETRFGQDSTRAIGISISGGGSRAQYFGLGILIGLDEIKKDSISFLDQLDYFSTVSGGGFAVGYYLSLMKNNVLLNRSFLDFWHSDDRKIVLQEFLSRDVSVTSVFKLSRYEKNRIRKPYPTMIETELLQYGKIYNGKKIERLYLSDFFIPAKSDVQVTMPMFVTNGTIYKGYGLPLSYAITGSAAFPGVLPMLKFNIKDNADSVIRVIDGAPVDNLGYTTLFELLHCDKLENKNKKLLIVDCSGLGKELQLQDNDKVKILKLLKKSLLFAVEINLFNSDDNIKYLTKFYDLNENNIIRIGFSSIKEKFIELEKNQDSVSLEQVKNLTKRINTGHLKWNTLYKEFVTNSAFNGYTKDNLSEIPTDRFSLFTIKTIFQLFELSSQVETKLKITPWEKEALIIAGRYVVYLMQNEIIGLLN